MIRKVILVVLTLLAVGTGMLYRFCPATRGNATFDAAYGRFLDRKLVAGEMS